MQNLWLMVNEEKIGPLGSDGVRDLLAQKLITLDTECRHGDGPWKTVRAFAGLIAPAPPRNPVPVPPPAMEAAGDFLEFEPPLPAAIKKPRPKASAVIAKQLDTERTWRWWFNFSPIKLFSVVVSVFGWFLIAFPVVLIGLAVPVAVASWYTGGLATLFKFAGPAVIGVSIASVPLLTLGTILLASVELAGRFCLIEEHLRAIREKSNG